MLALVKPKPKLETSLQFFKERGVDAVGIAPLDIVSCDSDINALTSWLQHSRAQTSLYIITSTEAAKRFINVLPDNWKGDTALCVGESTTQLVAPYFHQCIFPDRQNSEGTIEQLGTQTADVNDVVLLKGEGGRQLIREYVQQTAATFHELNLYKRTVLSPPFMPSEVHWQDVDIIVVTSLELLTALLHAFPEKNLTDKPIVVPSDRVKQQALTLGCKEIITSNGATNAHLLRCVNTLRRGRT